VWRRKATTIACSASVSTVDRSSVGSVFMSSTVARFHHFATVFGLIPSSQLSCESEAFDHSGHPSHRWRAGPLIIAGLTACVVVRSRDAHVPSCLLPFPRKDPTIKPREQTSRSSLPKQLCLLLCRTDRASDKHYSEGIVFCQITEFQHENSFNRSLNITARITAHYWPQGLRI
jgi:hypothetical protein